MNVTHESDWTEHKGTQTSPPMRHLASVVPLCNKTHTFVLNQTLCCKAAICQFRALLGILGRFSRL